jgi:hypothetical protein
LFGATKCWFGVDCTAAVCFTPTSTTVSVATPTTNSAATALATSANDLRAPCVRPTATYW